MTGARGRRPGRSGTRERILQIAGQQFRESGYAATSVRAIVRDAEVDPALVHHYFGSKRALFLAALEIHLDPTQLAKVVLGEGIHHAGARLIATALAVWESPVGEHLIAKVREDPSVASAFANFMTTEIFAGELRRQGIAAAEIPRRVALIEVQMIGLLFSRFIVHVDPIASMPRQQVIALLAPIVQHIMTGAIQAATSARS